MIHEVQGHPRAKPAAFPGGNTMPFAEYQAIDAMNQSRLKHILVSPLRFDRMLTAKVKETPALRFGRAADVAAFEPQRFAQQFVIKPEDCERRSTIGKEKWAAFVEMAEGKTILTSDEHDRAWKCGEIVRTHPLTAPYFLSGVVQVALQWTDPATGIKCKARIDLLSEYGRTIVDLKTCRTVDARLFGAQVNQLSYHLQGAFYREAWKACFGEYLPFKIAAVESDGDHDVGLFGLEHEALDRGNQLVRRALDTYARCRDAGQWPGRYSEEETIQLPSYALPFDGDETSDLVIGGGDDAR